MTTIDTTKLQVLVFLGGIPSQLMSGADFAALYFPVTPVTTAPVAPDPVQTTKPTAKSVLGIQIGTGSSGKVYLAADGNSCLYQVTDKGEILPRGFNLQYDLLTGLRMIKPVGPASDNYGTDVPVGYTLPDGYSWRQFPDKAYYIVAAPSDNTPAPWWLTATASTGTNQAPFHTKTIDQYELSRAN